MTTRAKDWFRIEIRNGGGGDWIPARMPAHALGGEKMPEFQTLEAALEATWDVAAIVSDGESWRIMNTTTGEVAQDGECFVVYAEDEGLQQ